VHKLVDIVPRRVYLGLMAVAALAAVVLSIQHNAAFRPALANGGPGIVDFEFSGSPERAAEILDGWGETGQDAAERAIGIDYGFLVAYSVFLALATAGVAAHASGGWRGVGIALSWLSLFAGLLDAIENTALLYVIDSYRSRGVGSLAPTIAAQAAGAKFAIILLAIAYLLGALLVVVVRRLRR
jgi:hypothetical protein